MSHAYPPELQELIDKQAIRDLLAAYFTAADRHARDVGATAHRPHVGGR